MVTVFVQGKKQPIISTGSFENIQGDLNMKLAKLKNLLKRKPIMKDVAEILGKDITIKRIEEATALLK